MSDEFRIGDGITLSGDNAEETVRKWLGTPKKSTRDGRVDEGVEWCRSRSDHKYYLKHSKTVRGKHQACYECMNCGRRIYI